jgi:hypothetical protein
MRAFPHAEWVGMDVGAVAGITPNPLYPRKFQKL